MSTQQKKCISEGDKLISFVGKKTWITGHRGMLGSALVRSLSKEGADLLVASSQELDLRNKREVLDWVDKNRPEFVFHAGAKVGGIHANATLGAVFLHDNLMIQSNVIDAAHQFGVRKLLFVASNCIYPTKTVQPISENALLSGPLEENIRSYAIGKIAGVEMCRAYRKQYGCNFISVIPPNLYGPGDNYHPHHGHVVAGILRRAYEAKVDGQSELVVWGDGTARREILYVDDLADAMKCLMAANVKEDLFNVGCGHDLSIADLAALIAEVVGFKGCIVYDKSKPNGTMKKLLDSSRIQVIGWRPQIDEKTGLKNAYNDFLELFKSKMPGSRL
ncbi:MAG: GDP-L-fucose synthase [Proteobacteria bacterium]|nr:GDP-L-fucose synthase [Pseudomonadota bacterium]MBU1585906.1 GDP-L-fucose synthase [Pseudomonadota bacterium]MBU2456188.1 GDP-L-fucose synthase [Pseudomonadota bacterium]MBU2627613.1 GDP-L-fucose synthase [Pseudomonadota bacterium]